MPRSGWIGVLVLCLGGLGAAAQQPPDRQVPAAEAAPAGPPEGLYSEALLADLERLHAAALASDYAWRQTAHLTNTIGPRLPGSPQAQAAVEHVRAELARLGLTVRLEPVSVPHWKRGEESAELVAWAGQPPGATQKIAVTALGGSTPTPPEGLKAEVVVVTSFDHLRALGVEAVRGKIVLFDVPFDTRLAEQGHALDAYVQVARYRGKAGVEAAPLGAAAVLVRSAGGARYRLPHTGASDPAGIPAGAVAAEDAELIAQLARQGLVRMRLTLLWERLQPDVESLNVVADLAGAERPEEVVVVSGHLDSWDLGTGAIDDAVGVAAAMATAHLVHKLGLRPRRTIRVIAWMDEETAGSGHEAYAAAHAGEFPSHVAAIESDLGAGHPAGFVARITPEAAAWLQPVQEVLRRSGAGLLRLSPTNVGADLREMGDAGVPTFGVLQDVRSYVDWHHTAADTLDKVDPRELAENVAAVAVLAHALAEMRDPLPR